MFDRPPTRGEVWTAYLDPVVGREQAGRRPVLVVSDNELNRGPGGLAIVLPITSRLRRTPYHVRISPPEGGLARESDVMCEQIRSVARERLLHRRGVAADETLTAVQTVLGLLLRLN